MRNIIQIIKDDFRSIATNVIALVVIVGIVVMPSMYAWFNIAASWDPYSNTKNLDIAVASEDEGYNGKLSTVTLELGDTFLATIQKKDSFNWVMTSPAEAREGVKSGKYYAAIVIDEQFSENLMSVFGGHDIKKAGITYYQNEKENAIASKVTTKGVDSVQQLINDTYEETIFEALLGVMKAVTNSQASKDLTESAVDGIVQTLGRVRLQIDSIKLAVDATYSSIDTLSLAMGSIEQSKIADSSIVANLKNRINKIDEELKAIDVDKLPEGELKDQVTELKSNVDVIKKSLNSVVDDVKATEAELDKAEKLLKGNLSGLKKKLKATSAKLSASEGDIDDLINRLNNAMESEDLDTVKAILGEDAGELSSYLAAPVSLDTTRVYPVENYGSAMAPFYTSLAIWVGGTVLVAMLLVSMDEARRKRYKNLTGTQVYVGRYFIFLIIGLLQTLIICAGDLWFLGIQCVHPLGFILAGLVASFIFVNITYTLTATFGDIGKAICVILMVIQVAGSGGTFPVEMQPVIFQMIQNLLPFTHSMTAMREAIMGTYGSVYWIELGKLMLYLVPNFIIGFVLRGPIAKAGNAFHEALEETKVL